MGRDTALYMEGASATMICYGHEHATCNVMTHDVVIIGGGSAGYAAARTARDEGADVGIIDHGPLGGLCILRGCMPTKTILRSSDVMSLMNRAEEFGLKPVSAKADLSSIISRKARLIGEFADDRIRAPERFPVYLIRGTRRVPLPPRSPGRFPQADSQGVHYFYGVRGLPCADIRIGRSRLSHQR